MRSLRVGREVLNVVDGSRNTLRLLRHYPAAKRPAQYLGKPGPLEYVAFEVSDLPVIEKVVDRTAQGHMLPATASPERLIAESVQLVKEHGIPSRLD